MGFSVIVASVILFSAFLFGVSVAYDHMNQALDRVSKAADVRVDSLLERSEARVAVVNASYSAQTLLVNVTNSGSTTLDPKQMDVLVNGQVCLSFVRSVGGADTSVWAPGQVLKVTIPGLPARPTTTKLVFEWGISAYVR